MIFDFYTNEIYISPSEEREEKSINKLSMWEERKGVKFFILL